MQKGLKICTIRDVSLSLLLVYFSSGVLLKGKLVILLAWKTQLWNQKIRAFSQHLHRSHAPNDPQEPANPRWTLSIHRSAAEVQNMKPNEWPWYRLCSLWDAPSSPDLAPKSGDTATKVDQKAANCDRSEERASIRFGGFADSDWGRERDNARTNRAKTEKRRAERTMKNQTSDDCCTDWSKKVQRTSSKSVTISNVWVGESARIIPISESQIEEMFSIAIRRGR